ncbi:response regulator [Thalassotalea euphylliae]|uniref:Response regulator n=1 Tax=Thalassotalea euphylliae TaxID=1655234 RepID=A0A3E0UGW7_9GAMM|nr:response regulator [Thalassotalea euphylliae]
MLDKELKNALEHFDQLNVLIIEDNTLVHGLLTDALYELGIKEIRCAQNAYYGLRLCEEMHFHIVICSFNVQSDKDGFHLLEELKFRGFVKKSTVLIFLSAETSETLVNSIVELQPDDFWVKPLSASNVKKRLTYALQIKRKLFNIYQAVDNKNSSKAIYYADRYLLDASLEKYFPSILRMKGDSFLQLREFSEAERFFKELLNTYQYSWVYLGYVKALLKQGRIDEIQQLLAELTGKPDTRFATHDMLAQYYIEQENYAQAYDEIKLARELAPRNIERNKKYWDLARLNHDHLGQYQATKSIATYAKNSVHDSPRLLLNVIRAGIDLACTLADSSSEKVLQESERYIKRLQEHQEFGEFKEQLLVAQARILNVRKQNELAERLVETHLSLRTSTDIEDNLDKVKVFHELGMREEAITILQAISNQIAGENLTSQVVSKYVEQEMKERQEIFFTARQLHEMAVEHYQKKRLEPALTSLMQALELSPQNSKIAISMLKVLLAMKRDHLFQDEHQALAEQGFNILNDHHFTGSSLEAVNKLKGQWQATLN